MEDLQGGSRSVEASRQPKPNYVTACQRSSTDLPLTLFLFLFSVYLLTYSPRFHSSDGLAVFATAESLVRRGEWDADQIRWMGLGQGILGVDGHLYTRKGVVQSLLTLPLVWLGMLIPIWGPATTALLFNSIVTAFESRPIDRGAYGKAWPPLCSVRSRLSAFAHDYENLSRRASRRLSHRVR